MHFIYLFIYFKKYMHFTLTSILQHSAAGWNLDPFDKIIDCTGITFKEHLKVTRSTY